MKVKISDLRLRMENSLRKRGLDERTIKSVVDAYLEAELTGKKTHGIGKLFLLDKPIASILEKPKVIKDKGNYAFVDGGKSLGHTTADMMVDILLEKVSAFDNAFVGSTNSFYYSMLSVYARRIADAGFVGIILNNGGPATVTPFGGTDAIFGTNPVAVGIPCSRGAIVLDMATSEKPWGEVNLAKVEGRSLQEKTFLDSSGEYTNDPSEVSAIVPFGGYKGSALNFVFEILTGAFVCSKMGLASSDAYDLGFLFIAISPEMFTTKEKFDVEVVKLIDEVKSSRKIPGVSEIMLPGENSERLRKHFENIDDIEIEESVWNKLLEYEAGDDVMGSLGLKV